MTADSDSGSADMTSISVRRCDIEALNSVKENLFGSAGEDVAHRVALRRCIDIAKEAQ